MTFSLRSIKINNLFRKLVTINITNDEFMHNKMIYHILVDDKAIILPCNKTLSFA